MTREEQLMQEYEDLTFKILMDRVAQAEGARLLEENERLLADPEAAVPESVQRRVEKTIQDAFDGRKKEFARRSLRKALKVAVIAAILLATTVTVTFAVSPTIRANVINKIMNIYDTHTEFFFEEEGESSELPSPEGFEIQVGWLPEGLSMANDISNGQYSLKRYENKDCVIRVGKSSPQSYSIDTEDAELSSIEVQGYEATLIEKDGENHVIWVNDDTGIVYFVYTEGVTVETMLKVAENIA